MPVREHQVSFRNGSQIMVAGLKLRRELGYCRGAAVSVTDPSGNPANSPWQFVVANDEHATLTSKNPPAPQWIQPGVRFRIEVSDSIPATVVHRPAPAAERPGTAERLVSASELGEWRRALLQILDRIDDGARSREREGPAARIDRLRRADRIPGAVAAMMRTVTEMRNRTEYDAKTLSSHESAAVRSAWAAVREWANHRR